MIIKLDPAAPLPPYEQIRAQITTMIATGVLAEESRLPSIRQLATDLGLAGGTVARAYRELEAKGAIETRGRHGTFVSGKGPKLKSAEANGRLAEAAHSFAVQVRQLGADPEVALARARKALEEFA